MQGGSQELLTAGSELVADVLARFGRVRFRALGTSMAPTIQSGDVLEVQRCSVEQLRVGDIVLVIGPSGIRVHRLVMRGWRGDPSVVVTRGDAHWRTDGPVHLAEAVGQVVRVTRADGNSAVPSPCTPLNRLRGFAKGEWDRGARALRRGLRNAMFRATKINVR